MFLLLFTTSDYYTWYNIWYINKKFYNREIVSGSKDQKNMTSPLIY